ncbi:hypothetical protein SARC_04070 [Sphaeroforma arctica JP610]|uniref:Integral membrane bound transporter domain-containing protein n=1 Tax=Sphaeroforma arctica JP610 TaxID=667725 RepID=A0A0L0G3I8_9EUKA|nr:hypothetical protein SARC_04070 [Sphaeroforma arctica JP610]KNC83672.1 hypothetical protein SARC_04070 [Sphaeroforma arctica JP610]|eukprot:XP_014157574.1 hypothetical protein SARC_04070 [Sphaeroforma arctica JP610]
MAAQGGIADDLETDLFRQERQERTRFRLFSTRAQSNSHTASQPGCQGGLDNLAESGPVEQDASRWGGWAKRLLPRWKKRSHAKPEELDKLQEGGGVNVSSPLGAETDAFLSDIPDTWSNPRPVYYFLSDERRTNSRFFSTVTDPRIVRSLRLFLFGIPAFYLSVFDTPIGKPAYLIGMVFYSASLLDVQGMMSSMVFAFTALLMVASFVLTSLLLMAQMATDGYGLLILTYLAIVFIFGLGIVGPLGGLGRNFGMFAIVTIANIFWQLFPMAEDGFVVLVPWNDVIQIIEEGVVSGFDELLQSGGLVDVQQMISQLAVQIQTAAGTTDISFLVPPGNVLSGYEVDVTIIQGTSIQLTLAPGMWVVTAIVWGSHNGIITSLGNVLLQVLIGYLIYLVSFIPPPYTSLMAEARLAQARVLQSIIHLVQQNTAKRQAAYKSTEPDATTQNATGKGAGPNRTLSDDERRDLTLSVGQTGLEQLEGTAAKLKLSKMLEPTWLSPNILARPHAALMDVNVKLTALTTEILLQSLDLLDRGADKRPTKARDLAGLLELRGAALSLLDLCGQGICLVPRMYNREEVQGIAEKINEAESVLKAKHKTFQEGCKRLTETAIREADTVVEAESILKEAGVRDTEVSLGTFFHPISLSTAVKELLHEEYNYSIMHAVMSLAFLLLGFGLASAFSWVVQTLKMVLRLPQLLRKSSWIGPGAWWADREGHAVFKYTVSLLIVFLIPLYWVQYRTWIWPAKENPNPSLYYIQTATPNNFESWVMLTFVICYFPTLESTVHKTFARVPGATLGCLTAWLVVWSSDGNGWGIVFWLCSCLAAAAYMAASDGDSVVWVSPAWGYLWRAAQISLVVITMDYWKSRETRTIENFVLSRFLGTVLGAALAMFVSGFVLPMGSGINARLMCIETFRSLSTALVDAVNALAKQSESAAGGDSTTDLHEKLSGSERASDTNLVGTVEGTEATAGPKKGLFARFRKSKGESASDAEMGSESVQKTPRPSIFETAKAELKKGQAQLTRATDLLKQSVVMSDGPLVCTDGRLYDLRLHLATLQHVAGAVHIAEVDLSNLTAPQVEGASEGNRTSEYFESTEALKKDEGSEGTGTVGGGIPPGLEQDSEIGSRSKSKILLHGRHKKGAKPQRRCPLVLDEVRVRELEAILERCTNELTGVLLSQSTMDVSDSPLVSRLIFDDEARELQEAALRALLALPTSGSGAFQIATESIESMCLRIRHRGTDCSGMQHETSTNDRECQKDADSPSQRDCLVDLVEDIYSIETLKETLLALSLSRFAVFSALIINALYLREPQLPIPVMQRLLTVQNYQSRRFKKLEARAATE